MSVTKVAIGIISSEVTVPVMQTRLNKDKTVVS